MDRSTQLTVRPAPYGTSCAPPPPATASLPIKAARVLDANWTGRSTVPSRDLYPHQWSWDSAFIAIGLRHLSPRRAQTELETLLAAQWADGRVPHIVFNPSVPLDAYFPSPDFWRSSTAGRSAGAPRTVQTSGIVQPPVHALAAWLVHRADPELSRARGFLARVYPRLAAWHRYLLHRRDLGGGGLVSVVHPWEQGMDNSPCWDAPLARITPAPARSFRRADLDHGAPEDRPTDLDYGRYVRLAADYRDAGYADGGGEFAVEDPAFNALLIASEQALARIAEELGASGAARRARADRLTAALVDRLWDPAAGMFRCRDLRASARSGPNPVGRRGVSGAGGQPAVCGPGDQPRSSGASDRPAASSSGGRPTVSGPSDQPRASDASDRPAASGPDGRPAASGVSDPPRAATTSDRPRAAGAGGQPAVCGPGSCLIPERGVSGLVPLLLPGLPREIAAALVRTLCGPHFGLGDRTRLVPSYDLLGEAFDPHRYWRGPAWFNTGWLLERGLRVHGERERADALRAAVLQLAEATGFAEYVDPYTGEACGATGFGWTAALALDLHHELHQDLLKGAREGVSEAATGTFDRNDEGGDRA
ncbi:MGH1-like glycoside hydrolase domain-containing protein [Streptomyces sp. NBC_00557]|uniref:MGH1-like glycoside hydrolase domain-containing protein n=1 Tax=Streptomyces sp. NBC_00557 TaxID=2975776 RepID=UPI003FCC4555|nr:hypothetical protein OG956_24200 [Streptomyces sp. NBC_00557]